MTTLRIPVTISLMRIFCIYIYICYDDIEDISDHITDENVMDIVQGREASPADGEEENEENQVHLSRMLSLHQQ